MSSKLWVLSFGSAQFYADYLKQERGEVGLKIVSTKVKHTWKGLRNIDYNVSITVCSGDG